MSKMRGKFRVGVDIGGTFVDDFNVSGGAWSGEHTATELRPQRVRLVSFHRLFATHAQNRDGARAAAKLTSRACAIAPNSSPTTARRPASVEAATGERIAFEVYDPHRSMTTEREPSTGRGVERESGGPEWSDRTIELKRAPGPAHVEHLLGL